MMTMPNPGVLDHLIRERQEHLRAKPMEARAPARPAARVRVGRALIAVGSNLSGERVEQPARTSALSRAA